MSWYISWAYMTPLPHYHIWQFFSIGETFGSGTPSHLTKGHKPISFQSFLLLWHILRHSIEIKSLQMSTIFNMVKRRKNVDLHYINIYQEKYKKICLAEPFAYPLDTPGCYLTHFGNLGLQYMCGGTHISLDLCIIGCLPLKCVWNSLFSVLAGAEHIFSSANTMRKALVVCWSPAAV